MPKTKSKTEEALSAVFLSCKTNIYGVSCLYCANVYTISFEFLPVTRISISAEASILNE